MGDHAVIVASPQVGFTTPVATWKSARGVLVSCSVAVVTLTTTKMTKMTKMTTKKTWMSPPKSSVGYLLDPKGHRGHNQFMSSGVTVAEAKAGFSDLLRRAELGEEIIVTRNGEPIAKIGPLRTRSGGFFRGEIVVNDTSWWEADDEMADLFGS
jgi:prevent-host-death family protein